MRTWIPAAVLVAAIALVVPTTVAVPASAQKALDYLRSIQAPDGRIGGEASSAWAAIAFARAGIDPETVKVPGGSSLETFVLASTHPLGGPTGLLSLERQTLALVAAGLDPHTAAGFDAVAAIKAAYDGTQLGDATLLNDDIFGLEALHAAGVANADPVIQGVRAFVLANQQPNGAWSYGVLSPNNPDIAFAVVFADVDMTSQGLVSLIATGSAPTDRAVLHGISFMKLSQGLDGGCVWGTASGVFDALDDPQNVGKSNADSTSWVAMGLVAAGQDPGGLLWTSPTGANPLTFLASLQQADGHLLWRTGVESFSPESTTAYAVIAFVGGTFVG